MIASIYYAYVTADIYYYYLIASLI